MISGLSALSDAALQEGLGQLVNAELLYQRGRPPRAKYFFKHALVQDSAYQSLLKRTRQRYHLEFARLLEARYPESVNAEPELLAHHYTEAADPAKAYTFWKTAAQRALNASAMVEAVSHLESALEVLTEFPQDRARDEHELEVQTLLAPAKLAIKGVAYPPLEGTYNRALELCVQLDKPVERIIVMRGLQTFHMASGRLARALDFAEQIAALCEKLGEAAFRVAAAHVVGSTNFHCGNFSTALRALDKGIEIYDPDRHQIPNWPGGASGEQCHLYRALTLWIRGYPKAALQNCAAAVAISNQHANKFTLATTLALVALVHAMKRNMNETRDLADRGVTLSEEQSNPLPFILNFSRILRGWANLETGDADDCVEEMKQSMLAYRKTGASFYLPYFLVLQAEGLAKVGKPEEGLGAVDEVLSLIMDTGEHCWEADVHRVKGDLILAASGAVSDAERSYLEAIRVAQAQEAKSWELRAAISLARLWRDEGKPKDAHRFLATIYAWFEEGFDTFDLLNAKTLLDDLSSLQVA